MIHSFMSRRKSELCMWLEYEVEQKAKICMSAQKTYIGKILLVM
jgi:hypothetical protein